ncbi:MAG: hypothetical protein VX498_06490 [Myxococcota bacterium]|nr:hypothetical protein [Myxococcota bacterium]
MHCPNRPRAALLLSVALLLAACTALPDPLYGPDDEPVQTGWCSGELNYGLSLCSAEGCEPLTGPVPLEVARRPQGAITAMVGIQVEGLNWMDEVSELTLRFVDREGQELAHRQRRHLNTLCRSNGSFVLESVEIYFDPSGLAQSWHGVEGEVQAGIVIDGAPYETRLSAQLVAMDLP